MPTPAPEPAKPTLADLIASDDQNGISTFFAGQDQLNVPDADGSYPLHKAVEKGSAKTVELLLVLGAKTEVKDRAGRTPLRLAIDKGDVPCVKILAEKGADVFNSDGVEAALSKGGAVLSSAFNAKTINATGAGGQAVIHLAADRLLEDQTSRLLAIGADPKLRDSAGRSPLDLAFLHPDRIESARVAETIILKGGNSPFADFAWFVQAARGLDYNSLRYEDGSTPLHQAVAHRQKGFVQFLLERKVNTNVRNGAGSTPLHEAVRSGWLEGAELLLAGGADANGRDSFDNSPLHIVMPPDARTAGVAMLIGHGADTSLKDRLGDTPLHVAIQVAYPVDVIKALIAAKAPVDAQNASGNAPLHLAVGARRYDYAKALIEAGADIFLANSLGESPLSAAIAAGPDALDAILTQTNVRQRDNSGNAPLAIAVVLKAAPDAIAMIVAKGAEVNARNNAGDSALHIAVRQNLRSQGETLLLAKADIFSSNVRGESALSLALTAPGGPVEWLFPPATMASRDANGDSPLHHAARRNLASAVEFLVQRGAALEAADAAGETALHQAVKADASDAALALIKLGAALTARDAMGDTPLHSCVLWTARKCLPVVVMARPDLDARDYAGETALHQAVRKRDRDALKFLLAKGADPDTRDNRGATPLALAVKAAAYDLERDLLAAGAELDARDQAGRTPLYEAVSASDADSTKLLVDAGADIMARNSDGESPFALALKRKPALFRLLLVPATVNRADPEGRAPLRTMVDSGAPAEFLELALAAGARIDARDRDSATALHAAVRAGNKDLAAALARAGADAFARDKDGQTPVALAIAAGQDMVKAMVTATGVAAKDKLGNGWLHYAAMAGSSDAATWLITAGADRSAKNISGEIAADLARKRGKNDLAELLKPTS
jgi:ankyrin repeat protein